MVERRIKKYGFRKGITMIGIIKDVLEYFKDSNLHSESAREAIAEEIIKRLDETSKTDYVYSRDLLEKKEKEKTDLFPVYEGGHLG